MRDEEPSLVDPSVEQALESVRNRSIGAALPARMSVTINFHPDWHYRGQSVIHRLAKDGYYRSQFETGTSNGGLTAHSGGERWIWENRMFSGAYDDAPVALRPKYGALDEGISGFGAAPRFGSAHFRLRPEVMHRTTFCFPDSCYDPTDFGVADRMDLIAVKNRRRDEFEPLDQYIEAHIHGPLKIDTAFAALVLDPSFRGTEVEDQAGRLGCAVEWHSGYQLSLDQAEACAQYRGVEMAEILPLVAKGRALKPIDIGRAQQCQIAPQVLLKRLWHCMARFGMGAA